ncbi:MAG: hypothetical protein KDB79_12455 [Acidobacteria bacterium]|nr:hypothetical protein [Acidobacteriota bacterium]
MNPNRKKLLDLATGTRLLYRAKDDWRTAVISKFDQEKATLIVCSPTGRTYRLRRDLDSKVLIEGNLIILKAQAKDSWRENFTTYDFRW